MAGFANQRGEGFAPVHAQASSKVELAQNNIGVSGGGLREAALQENRSHNRGVTPFSPENVSNLTSVQSDVMSHRRINHLQGQLENVLSGVPPTRESILANPEARQIQLEILKVAGSLDQPTIGLAPASATQKHAVGVDTAFHNTRHRAAGGVSDALHAGNHVYAVQLLQADLKQVLGNNPASPENILASAEARKIQLKILDHMSEFAQFGASLPHGALASAGIKTSAGHTSLKERVAGRASLMAQGISAQRIEIYQADLRDALNGAVATPENILASADARRAQRMIIGEAAKISAFSDNSPGALSGGIASPDGASGRSADSRPGRSKLGSVMATATLAEMSVSLLSEDIKRALNSSTSSPQSLLKNREAREAQFHILAIRANHVNSAELAFKGGRRSGSENGAVGTGHSMARAHLTQQMMSICNAELHDALSGKDATPEAVAQNPRAYQAFQRLQYLSSGNMTALEATLNQE